MSEIHSGHNVIFLLTFDQLENGKIKSQPEKYFRNCALNYLKLI